MSYFTAERNADSFKNEQDGRNNQGCFISFLFHFFLFSFSVFCFFCFFFCFHSGEGMMPSYLPVTSTNSDRNCPIERYYLDILSFLLLIHVRDVSKWSLLWSRKSSKDSVVWSDIGRCIKDFELTMAWWLAERHIIVYFDRLGECSPEKDCCRYWWLTFRQPERKSLLESRGRETVRQLRGDHGTG